MTQDSASSSRPSETAEPTESTAEDVVVWSGDPECVYESSRGYVSWFGELVRCFGDFGIGDVDEIWHRSHDGRTWIDVVFEHAGDLHHVWLERRNDHIGPHLLDVFNAALGGPHRFEWRHDHAFEVCYCRFRPG